MSNVTTIKIRGYHTDLFGHVNNARFLEFLEEGRWAFLEERGALHTFAEKGWNFMAVNINISYREEVSVGELLQIHTETVRFGTKSATFRQECRKTSTGTNGADADVTFVVVDNDTGRTLPMEGELRTLFAEGNQGS